MFLRQYIYLNLVASVFLYVNGDTASNEDNHGKCILPNHPPNGKWTIVGGSEAEPGSEIPFLTAITYFCNEEYKLSSDYRMITCLGKHWNLLPPECLSGGQRTNKVKREVIPSRKKDDDQRDKRYAAQGARGGDGIVIKSGGGRTVIGPGQGPYYDERGVARGGQGGIGVIRGGGGGQTYYGEGGGENSGWSGNTRQRGGGQSYYGDGRRGQDGLVIGPGETVNGYGIGIGQPGHNGGRGGNGIVVDGGTVNGGLNGYRGYPKGSNYNRQQGGKGYGQGIRTQMRYYDRSPDQNADWIDGRGGDGIVIRNGRITGNIVGIGGQGGSGGYYRRKRVALNPPIILDCGETRTRELIVDGKTVTKTIYPWATAVYKKMKGEFNYICAATMLTQRIFVTVAHCVTNDENPVNVVPAEEFKIAVGKYYQDYNNSEDTQAQFSDVMKVLVNPHYRGSGQNFASDMAFLITKDQLLLSKVVQPVCYRNLPNIDLNDGTAGVLTGWGFPDSTSLSPSNELQGISLPSQNKTTCLRELPADYVDRYLTYDKMCTGHYNKNTSFCAGISGNGLSFPDNGRYYIHGIIGLGTHAGAGGLCNRPAWTTLYTKVSAHYDWLEHVIAQYK